MFVAASRYNQTGAPTIVRSTSAYNIYRTRIAGYRVFFAVRDTHYAILYIDKREEAYGNVRRLVRRFKDLFDGHRAAKQVV